MVTVILCLVCAAAGLALGWWLWGRYRTELVEQLWTNLRALAEGKYQTRIVTHRNLPGYMRIVDEFNEMARRMENQFITVANERDVLRHILKSMTTGVVYISNRGRITMVNEAAERMFMRPNQQWIGHNHWSVFRQYPVGAYIEETSIEGKPSQREIELAEGRIVDVQLIPVASPQASYFTVVRHDVLMICNDVSEWYRLEHMRTEFVANVSHELKTPVAAIRGFAETLLEGDVDDDEVYRHFLQTIYDEAYRMGNLVSDLLELSKLEGTRQAVQPERIELASVTERAYDRVKQAAEKKSIALVVEPMEALVWADEDKLLQVLLNLMTNAINYTPQGGRVKVWKEELLDKVKIHVQDTGIGIAPEHQSRVFERFYRVNRDRSRITGGTGLGLAIVKHIISAHGGQVGVDSRVGEGSDFWFTLPRLEKTLP